MEALLILVALTIGIYGWLSSIELGVSLIRLLPSSTLTRHGLRLFAPRWEVAHFFLILAVAEAMVFFGNGVHEVTKGAPIGLSIGATALVMQIFLRNYLFYNKAKTGLKWKNVLFFLVSYIKPLSFSAVGVKLLTGHNFWQLPTGWAMMAAMVVVLMASAMSFVYYLVGHTPQGRIQAASRILNIAFCGLTAIALQQIIASHQPHLLNRPFVYLMIVVAFVALWQALLWISGQDRYMWWYMTLLFIFGPVFLILANKPYIIFSELTVQEAYINSTHTGSIVGLAVLFPIMLVSFGLLMWLTLNPRR